MGMKNNQKYFDVSKENLEVIEEFKIYREANNIAKSTIRTNVTMLTRLGNYLKDTHFKNTTDKNLIEFFAQKDIKNSWRTRDHYGTICILFFRWLFKLKRKERPHNMEWFNYTTKATRRQSKDPKAREKYFITREEYERVIEYCSDYMERALFEVLYACGGRPDEVANMKIKDVELKDNGEVYFIIYKSKTDPREVPIAESIDNLLRWLDFHPDKDNPDAPLWITFTRKTLNKSIEERKMHTYTIGEKLKIIKARAGLKDTITPKCFRKTRASIMFPNYTDKEMGFMFGWTAETVPLRRQEYDLTDNEEFYRKVFAKSKQPKTRDALERKNEALEKKHEKELAEQKEKINELKAIMEIILLEPNSLLGLSGHRCEMRIREMLSKI